MNSSAQRDLPDYDFEDQRDEAHERHSGVLPAWSHYHWLPLEDVPQGVLLHHLDAPDVPDETKAAIRQELHWRLQDLRAWERSEGERNINAP
jgi:hypothetical protein